MPVDCSNCGVTNADGSQFCISCGRALPALSGTAAPPSPEWPQPGPVAPQVQPQIQQPPMQPQTQPGMAPPPPPPMGGYPAPPGMAPGPYGAPMQARPTVSNNMGLAIAATVVGFLCGCIAIVPGIVAIVMASQVNGKYAVGDVYGAQRSARAARTWSIVAFIIAGTLIVVGILLNALGNGSVHFSTSN